MFRDFTAGLIVAMVAIPLAMGFAMASGFAAGDGASSAAPSPGWSALFGGSKYQVYGPTAAFIPVIAGDHGQVRSGHGFLVWRSLVAGGAILMLMGLARLGRIVARVPHSIVVGFTIGIAIVIALSQIEQVLGLTGQAGLRLLRQDAGHRRAISARSTSMPLLIARDDLPRHQVPAQDLDVHSRAAHRARRRRRCWRRRSGPGRA